MAKRALGRRADFTSNGKKVTSNIYVDYEVSVTNTSWTKSKITFTFTTRGTTKVWNHGVIANVTLGKTTEPAEITNDADEAQDKSTIVVGCKNGWAPESRYVSGGNGELKVSFSIDRTNSSKSISYTVRAYNGYVANYTTNNGTVAHHDLRNQGLIGSHTSTVSIDAKITAVTVGNTTITDNKNNTLTVEATKGSAGNANSITAAELEWTYYKPGTETWYTVNTTGSYITEAFTEAELTAGKKIKTINIADLAKTNGSAFDTKTIRRFAFKVNTTGTYGSKVNSSWDGKNNTNNVANNEFYINQYIPPQDISAADFELAYNKNRLTIKEPWTLKWGTATEGNAISPVYGYRIRLFKKSPTDTSFKSIPIIDDNEVQLSVENAQSDGTIYYHLDIGTDTQYTINPASCNLAAKDMFKFSIQPYTKYGTGTLLLGTEVSSSTGYAIQNAGIVRIINANGKGQEGNVWIKVSNTEWKEAETVNYKVSNTAWKESQ